MAGGSGSDGLDDLPAGGGGSAERVVGKAAKGWREAGGERKKKNNVSDDSWEDNGRSFALKNAISII